METVELDLLFSKFIDIPVLYIVTRGILKYYYTLSHEKKTNFYYYHQLFLYSLHF